MLKIFYFDKDPQQKKRTVFPEEIENDPWVMYHGTSSFNEETIERDGFEWKSSNTSRAQLQQVVDVFENMQWCGLDGSSLAVLKPFSVAHDFNDSETSPIYFAGTGNRALLYTQLPTWHQRLSMLSRSVRNVLLLDNSCPATLQALS